MSVIATSVERLSREISKDAVQIDVGRRPLPATGITAAVYPVAQNRKTSLLTLLLRGPNMNSVLVFTRTKHRAERLGEQLQSRGFAVAIIHGNRSQGQREQALEQFKAGKAMVMVATDIAARGLDIQDISHVINYDVPNTAEDYVHRIGRTGRAGRSGRAITFVAGREIYKMQQIMQFTKARVRREKVPSAEQVEQKRTTQFVETPASGAPARSCHVRSLSRVYSVSLMPRVA
jgi:superfamily II DNA/RNA helicase